MATSIIQTLIREGALVLFHDYTQHVAPAWDFSGNLNHGQFSVGCTWQGGGVLTGNLTDEILVLDDPSLRITDGTLFVRAGDVFRYQGANQSFINKYDGGLGYQMWADATDLHLEADGVPKVACDIIGARSLAITFESGHAPVGYRDGLSLGAMDAATDVTASTVNLEVGNYVNSRPVQSPLGRSIICNIPLTATELARLDAEVARI